jgi:hypothetical protein
MLLSVNWTLLLINLFGIDLYIQNSNSIESKNKFDVFLQSNFTDSDKAVESFNSILYEDALHSAQLVTKSSDVKN